MSIHETQNTTPRDPRGSSIHTMNASIEIIGDDGTEYGIPRLPADHRDPQPDLPPVRLTCPPTCACWRALESGEVRLRSIDADELVAWMAALAGPLRSGLAHNRMYHHIRRTKPESPLNVGYVGIARGLAAFGLTPDAYELPSAGRPFCPVGGHPTE